MADTAAVAVVVLDTLEVAAAPELSAVAVAVAAVVAFEDFPALAPGPDSPAAAPFPAMDLHGDPDRQ